MKKHNQLLLILIISLLIIINHSCDSSNFNQNEGQSYSSTSTRSLQQTEKQEIEQALAEQRRLDEQNKQEEQRRQVEQKILYAEAITILLKEDSKANSTSNGDYTATATKMRMINYNNCPRDFAVAYVKHIQAWEYAAKIQKALETLRSDDNVKGTLFLSLLSSITESEFTPLQDALEAENELKKYQDLASTEIKTTWNDIELLTISYGGTLPK